MPKQAIDTRDTTWVLKSDLPKRARPTKNNDALFFITGDPQVANKTIFGNFTPGTDVVRQFTENVQFQIVPSPIAPLFRVEYAPLYKGNQMSTAEHIASETCRLLVEFSAYHDAPSSRSQPYESNSSTVPAGPLHFSSQLRNVRYFQGTSSMLPKAIRDLETGHVFVWMADSCTKYAFSQPLPVNQDHATRFNDIIDQALKETTSYFYAAFKGTNAIPKAYWPHFAAMPLYLAPYWPWVAIADTTDPDGWKQTMEFASPERRTFELWPDLIDKLLTVQKQPSDATPIQPRPFGPLAALDRNIRFRDGRQYLAFVLGSFAYEEEANKVEQKNTLDGTHICEVIQEDAYVIGTKKYLIFLNIQPTKRSDESDVPIKGPAIGEQVQVTINWHNIDQTWQGTVVKDPRQDRQYGRQVAIVAFSKAFLPEGGHVVTDCETKKAEIVFGQHAQNSTKMKENIMAFITGHMDGGGASTIRPQMLKELVLSQDLWAFQMQHNKSQGTTLSKLPPNMGASDMLQQIRKICRESSPSLTPNQVKIVEHYFTHAFTLVRGPPGTGKSTLIDTIARLENYFGQRHWICTESNDACNVLVEKAVVRQNNTQPFGTLRVRTATEERLEYNVVKGRFDVGVALLTAPGQSSGETQPQAMLRYLNEQDRIEKAMSLESLIKKRIQLWQSGQLKNQVFPTEAQLLQSLQKAAAAFQTMRLESDEGAAQFVRRQQAMERKYMNTLSQVQVQYIAVCNGIYSTAAAANGRLLAKFAPHSMVMDEASQFQEATAVGAIASAIKQGELRRVMLIGDDLQLPPTVMSGRNPFRATAKLSLFERLIKAGFEPLTLDTQYRMAPSIASTVQDIIYKPVSITLENGDRTKSQEGQVGRFHQFVREFCKNIGETAVRPETNSIMISPEEWTGDPRTSKSLRAQGSTSWYNLGTAWIVFLTTLELLRYGYAPQDIMIISFYTDQVALLRAMFQDEQHDSRELADIMFTTVDGSQGRERLVTIVDAVKQGAANGEGMGFLGSERRRFNVAMSRAQAGRIVVANRGMVKSPQDTGVWAQFIRSQVSKHAVVAGARFHCSALDPTLNENVKGKMKVFAQRAASAAQPHRTLEPVKTPLDDKYKQSTFIHITRATGDQATKYLGLYKDLHVAIDKYLAAHDRDDILEEDIDVTR